MSFKWRDNSIRILAVLMALLLWIYVTNEQNPVTDQTFTIPLQHSDEPQGYVIKGLPNTVSIRVKGARSVIGTLSRDDFSARVNLLGVGEGQREIPVQITSPPGVEVLQIMPQVITVSADKITQKNVPVVVNLKGNPQAGLQVGEPVLRPPLVTVHGASSLLDKITRVGVTVDVNGAVDTIEREVAVETGVRGVTIVPQRVVVTVPVTKLPAKDLPVRIRYIGEPAAGYALDGATAQPSTVQITAPEGVLRGLTAISTTTVDITGITDDIEKEVGLILPDGARAVNPQRILIKMRISPLETEPPPVDESNPDTSGNT